MSKPRKVNIKGQTLTGLLLNKGKPSVLRRTDNLWSLSLPEHSFSTIEDKQSAKDRLRMTPFVADNSLDILSFQFGWAYCTMERI